MAVIGDEIAKGIIDKLLNAAFDYLADQKEWQTGMKSEHECLKDALPRIQAVVEKAENGLLELTDPLRKWLRQLKDALYDAEDVLDELQYLELQKQVEAEGSSTGKGKVRARLSNSKKKAAEIVKRAFKADPTLMALRKAVQRVNVVAAHTGEFNQHLQGQAQTQVQVVEDNRETSSLLKEKKLFGRDEQRDELLSWLIPMTDRSADDGGARENHSLGSLVGHGGMGKTTLVQSVLTDQRIQSHFDLRVWVCISNTFNVKDLTTRMLECVTGKRPEADSLEVLQNDLRKKLMSSNGPVLVVFDDAWNDKYADGWKSLLAPLGHGLPEGSRILLTTRMPSVADVAEEALRGSTAEPSKRFYLTGLPEADFLPLFDWHAFGGADPGDHMKLQFLGKKIAAKLGGLPLAAKVVGRMLNTPMREEYWESILNNNISKFEEGEQGIISILRISYHHLSKHLRPCFAYCSVFPQDHVFEKEKLIQMWIAAGLIQQSPQNPREALEETGRRYFDDLLKRSFFEPSINWTERYVMHDLLHELAESVSDGEYFRFEGDMRVREIPKSVRHLYFEANHMDHLNFLAAEDLGRLRTLHLIFYDEVPVQSELWRKILCSARRLRVLGIRFLGRGFPHEIGKLKHLKYLEADSRPEDLPAFRNYNLQYLYISEVAFFYCFKHSFRQNAKNLISLRRYGPRAGELDVVRKLTNLQELNFIVTEENEFKIGELKDLNQLRRLRISQLENVRSWKDCRAAELGKKEHLHRLELVWGSVPGNLLNRSPDSSEELVLDGFRPNSRVRELIIEGYGGFRSANWMKPAAEFVENLQFIRLEDCKNWEHLPPFGTLPYLKKLFLNDMPAVKQLDCEGGFPQLEVLEIRKLEKWEDLCGLDARDGQQCFPRLSKLVIKGCTKLTVFPSLPLGLTELDLKNVGLLALPDLIPSERDSRCSVRISSSASSSLYKLRISQCRKLTSAKALLRHSHSMLESLQIICPEDLSTDGYGELVGSLPLLLQGASACLSDLRLGCGSIMTSLPSQEVWGGLASLKDLHIDGCGALSSLEPLKALRCRLDCLEISECPKLVQAASTAAEEENSTFGVDYISINDPLLLLTEPLRNLDSVRQLTIKNCSRLESITKAEPWLLQNCSSLQSVLLFNTSSWQSLPAYFQRLSSLRLLHLDCARQLQSLPQLPLSLRCMYITGCNETLRERCRKDDGADWPNIEHIREIYLW